MFASKQLDRECYLRSIERLRNTLAMKVEKVHDLKVKVQELRFEAGHQEDEILLWNSKLEGDVGVFEMSVNDLDARIKELKSASLQVAKKVEEDQAAEIRERKYHEEMQFGKTKLEQNLKYEMQIEENPKNLNNKEQSINAKLPKLVVTKFSGTHTDWSRFWNQLKAEIDSADVHMSPITKFSYLNELLEPKVRTTIEGLPFTTKGYERAKNILKTKYGKESEIVNAHLINIMSPPVIYESNPNKILEFYETLSPNLQALETMGRIKEVNGYVSMTLDKLDGIRGDLVRTDDNRQDWEFPHLLEALP